MISKTIVFAGACVELTPSRRRRVDGVRSTREGAAKFYVLAAAAAKRLGRVALRRGPVLDEICPRHDRAKQAFEVGERRRLRHHDGRRLLAHGVREQGPNSLELMGEVLREPSVLRESEVEAKARRHAS